MEPSAAQRLIHVRFILNNIHAVTNRRAGSALLPSKRLASPDKHEKQVGLLTKAVAALRKALEADDESATAVAIKQVIGAMDFAKANASVALKAVLDQDNAGDLSFILQHYASPQPETIVSDLL